MKKQVEFKPPSDFVAEDSGGGSNVWKYVGIGCGVILLAVGIAFAFGAWKTASCCGDAMDVAKYSMAAQNTAKTFASNVSRGNADKAYELTSSSFQERVSPDNFRALLSKHAKMIEASSPRSSGMETNTDGARGNQVTPEEWSFTFEFAGPNSEKKLVMFIDVVRDGEGEDASFFVEALEFEERRRVLAAEPPAEAVLDFHASIQRGDYQGAYKLMSQDYVTKTDRAAFENFIGDYESAYLGTKPTIESVDYATEQATVLATTVGENGNDWEITYTVRKSLGGLGWSIAGIAPSKGERSAGEAAPGADAGQQPGPDGGDAEAGTAADEEQEQDGDEPVERESAD